MSWICCVCHPSEACCELPAGCQGWWQVALPQNSHRLPDLTVLAEAMRYNSTACAGTSSVSRRSRYCCSPAATCRVPRAWACCRQGCRVSERRATHLLLRMKTLRSTQAWLQPGACSATALVVRSARCAVLCIYGRMRCMQACDVGWSLHLLKSKKHGDLQVCRVPQLQEAVPCTQ
jgi:hypothetical protein